MECNVCQHEGPDVQNSSSGAGLVSSLLCSFCRGTWGGNTAIYPDNYSSEMKFTAHMVANLYWKLK